MNLTTVFQPLIFALILLSSQSPLLSQAQDKEDAYCEPMVKYPKSNDEYPATMIKNINGNYTPLIYWVYEVAGEIPKDRCEKVSRIIQARIDSKTLNKTYLKTGESQDGYPIICLVHNTDNRHCSDEDPVIIILSKGQNAPTILDKMLAIRFRSEPLKLTGEFRFPCGERKKDTCIDINQFLEELSK